MISFFANKHGSGEIRGRQMAAHLGAKLNPRVGYRDDVCIYVKQQPPENYPPHSYLDIVDEHKRIGWLKQHPDIGVIASSVTGKRYLEEVLGREVVLIPQHHCNFERVQTPKKLLRIGVVGGKASMPAELADTLGATRYECKTRQDVVEAYHQIDIQVIWRGIDRPLKNPLKIVNAASFGIPTIALPEAGYEEMEGYYTRATTIDEIWKAILRIGYCNKERLVEKADEYHIENIAMMYEAL